MHPLKYVLVKSPKGPSLCVGFRCPEDVDPVSLFQRFTLAGVIVEPYSWEKMMSFNAHYSYVYEIGAVHFDVACKVPMIPHDYFINKFCRRFVKTYKY